MMEDTQFSIFKSFPVVRTKSTVNPLIVVGIEFGLEYSAVSFATSTGAQSLQLLTRWKRAEMFSPDVNAIVPTSIAYPSGSKTPIAFGYEATDHGNSRNSRKVHGSKLFPALLGFQTNVEDAMALHDTEATEITKDFLQFIWREANEAIQQRHGKEYELKYTIKFVVAVPFENNEDFKETIFRIAVGAGLPGEIKLVSNAQVAAARLLDIGDQEMKLKKHESFVWCDLKEKSTAISIYQVKKLVPFSISFVQWGISTSWGFDKISDDIIKYINLKSGRYNAWEWLRPRDRESAIDQIHRIIQRYEEESARDFTLEVRGLSDLMRDASDEVDDNSDEDQDLVILPSSVVSEAFSNAFYQIQEQIDHQLRQAYAAHIITVRAIFIAGDSWPLPWLAKKLRAFYIPKGFSIISPASDVWQYGSTSLAATKWGLDYFRLQSDNTDNLNAKGY